MSNPQRLPYNYPHFVEVHDPLNGTVAVNLQGIWLGRIHSGSTLGEGPCTFVEVLELHEIVQKHWNGQA